MTIRTIHDLSSEKVDMRFVNPQTGPFYIEGAEPGDALAIHIVDMKPARSYGIFSTIPFFGGLTSTDRTAMLQEPLADTTWVYEVNTAKQMVGFEARYDDMKIEFPIECIFGTIGVAPAGNEVRSALVSERFGGNMDSPEVRKGSTIYLGVNVEGAMDAIIIIDLIKGAAPAWPRIESDDRYMAVGSYQLLSQITKAPIANVVDANFNVVIKAAKDLMPHASAFAGMHQCLPERAKGLTLN
jgi:acetamidase/formamidase